MQRNLEKMDYYGLAAHIKAKPEHEQRIHQMQNRTGQLGDFGGRDLCGPLQESKIYRNASSKMHVSYNYIRSQFYVGI